MTASLEPIEARAKPVARPPESGVRRFFDNNRAALGTLGVFVVMIAIFMAASPTVFLHWPIYNSVLVTLPVALCLVVPLVFVVTVGEIDLSFPATMGFSAWIFALVVHFGIEPVSRHCRGARDRHGLGRLRRALVVTAGLSSLIATLGMNFMLRGFIMIVTQGKSIALLELQDTTAGALFSSEVTVSLSRSSGRSASSSSRSCSSTVISSARACARSATIRTARARWASTSRACAS